MKARCLNPQDQNYHRYGARGITVCQRWVDSFENFLADMGEKPDPNLTLDRIDNDKGYEPSNCRWADMTTQSNNRRQRVLPKTCARGHEYTAIKSDGTRYCAVCHNARTRAYKARVRAAKAKA